MSGADTLTSDITCSYRYPGIYGKQALTYIHVHIYTVYITLHVYIYTVGRWNHLIVQNSASDTHVDMLVQLKLTIICISVISKTNLKYELRFIRKTTENYAWRYFYFFFQIFDSQEGFMSHLMVPLEL